MYILAGRPSSLLIGLNLLLLENSYLFDRNDKKQI